MKVILYTKRVSIPHEASILPEETIAEFQARQYEYMETWIQDHAAELIEGISVEL